VSLRVVGFDRQEGAGADVERQRLPPNAAVVAFSLSLTARDGLWALLAFGFSLATIAWLVVLAT